MLGGSRHSIALVSEAHPIKELHQSLQIQDHSREIPLYGIPHQSQIAATPQAMPYLGLPKLLLHFVTLPQTPPVVQIGEKLQPGLFVGVLFLGAVVVKPEGRFKLPLPEKLMIIPIIVGFVPSIDLSTYPLGQVLFHQGWQVMAIVGGAPSHLEAGDEPRLGIEADMGLVTVEVILLSLLLTLFIPYILTPLSPPTGFRVSGAFSLLPPPLVLLHINVGYGVDGIHHLDGA